MASTLTSGSRKPQAGLYAHTHTINRIYNLWIPLTVWTHNSNSSNVTFLKTHFALYFSLIQSTMQNNSSLSEPPPTHLFHVLHVQVGWVRATRRTGSSFISPWLWYASVPSHTCCSGLEMSLTWLTDSLVAWQTTELKPQTWKLPMKCRK